MSDAIDPIRPRLGRFQDLMRHRVREVLLVSSLYDSFILVEDGQINEALLREFAGLRLSDNPEVKRVSTAADALREAARDRRYDLVIVNQQVADLDAAALAASLRERGVDAPVVLLGYDNRQLTQFVRRHDVSALAGSFLWQGDVRILLAIVKLIEDRINAPIDCVEHGVPAILVVEDNIRFYSSFLPLIYSEVLKHTQGHVNEGLNLSQKVLRGRARPKVLLCCSYEEALEAWERYDEHILGVISDIEFPRAGRLDATAGIDLARRMREERDDLPIVLQSSIEANRGLAEGLSASFLLKGSPVLLDELRNVLLYSFGFGKFKFRLPSGEAVGEAADLRGLIEVLRTVDAESLIFHGERNHFSNWLKARAEFELAERLRPQRVEDFADIAALRERLITTISDYRAERDRAIVADFNRERTEAPSSLTRIGSGSLGGKGRGLAFINRLLYDSNVSQRFPELLIRVPEAVVLSVEVFEEFLESNDLHRFALGEQTIEQIAQRFLAAPFPKSAADDLRVFLRRTDAPLAVRSSGLLEDSAQQPFAGIYQTFMLPNNHSELEARLVQLIAAIKRVYLSTFSVEAKNFLRLTPFRLEEERMAVVIQRVVGAAHGTRFYPDASGVACSLNYFPAPPLRPDDGIVALALGMGRTVVEGARCLRFSPRHPRHPIGATTAQELLAGSQREFFALDLTREPEGWLREGEELSSYALDVAEVDGTLAAVGSTYVAAADRIYDGIGRDGTRLVSFAPLLRHRDFPLPEMLETLLATGERGIGGPVEIEFALDLSRARPEFGFLQLRPMGTGVEGAPAELDKVDPSRVFVNSDSVLGNGRLDGVRDLVWVDPQEFDRLASADVAAALTSVNARLMKEERPYALIGVGRWGSTDPLLGIPVSWTQIAGVRVIVEAGFRDMVVEPSQGSHFFQNLSSCNVGYFTVAPAREAHVDWEWLRSLGGERVGPALYHVRLARPIDVRMDGRHGKGVICRPDDGP